jgi:hypothetical protein
MVLYNELFNIRGLKIYNSLVYCIIHAISYIFQQLLINIYTLKAIMPQGFCCANIFIINGIERSKYFIRFSFQQAKLDK